VPRGKDDKRRRSGRPKQARTSSSTPNDGPVAAVAGESSSEGAGDSSSDARDTGAPVSRSAAGGAEREVKDRLPVDVAVTEATSFLDGLLDRLAIDASVTIDVTDDGDLEAAISGSGLGRLIGPRGAMVRAVEELVRTRLQHAADGGSTPKLRLDVGGYRQLRRDTIVAVTDETIEAVRASGTPHVVDVVVAGERKTVHDRVGESGDGLTTRSEGEDPQRRVVVLPA
jgi:spoIIIJ-associated protein